MPNFINRVYAIIRKRPNNPRSREENDHHESSPATRGHTGHDHQDFASIPRALTTGFAPTHVDPTSERLGVSPSIETREPLPDNSVKQKNVTQRVSCFSQTNGVTVNGGEFYAVGGNMTIQRTELNNNNEIVVRSFENYAERTDRRMERLEEMIGVFVQAQYRSQMPPIISVDFIYVMDATGRKHPLTMNMASSLEQFHDALQVLFKVGTPEDKVLRRYMNIGAYILSIDDGDEGIQLIDSDAWSNVVGHGTTVVMSIVMRQEFAERQYKCPFCYNWNALKGQSSIDCCSCNRRFKVTSAGKKIAKLQTATVPYQERNLIRNIHLEQYPVGNAVLCSKTSGGMIFVTYWCLICGTRTQGDDPYCSPKCEE
ncbi:hypothetical protein GALMADRAFT_161217 [Galerina marginata CBS 339.88]|uniref:Ubiquitin-like domain-containing protein n=1 Tax=Galerina marginata (strain CBS 339.88) TaxID=685588 RepID=A0A067SDR3_GALM3|nr:hypothetical protein GALMADRAFT_161217 [Galerina marginata CBS 339.88]